MTSLGGKHDWVAAQNPGGVDGQLVTPDILYVQVTELPSPEVVATVPSITGHAVKSVVVASSQAAKNITVIKAAVVYKIKFFIQDYTIRQQILQSPWGLNHRCNIPGRGAILCARHARGGGGVCPRQTPRRFGRYLYYMGARRPSPEHADRRDGGAARRGAAPARGERPNSDAG